MYYVASNFLTSENARMDVSQEGEENMWDSDGTGEGILD